MTDNSTWAGMVAMNLAYHVYCSPCERHVEIDMTKLPPHESSIGRTFRCSVCGKPGSSIVTHKSANHSYPGAKPIAAAAERLQRD